MTAEVFLVVQGKPDVDVIDQCGDTATVIISLGTSGVVIRSISFAQFAALTSACRTQLDNWAKQMVKVIQQ